MRARFKLLATVLSAILLAEIVNADDTILKNVGDSLPITLRNISDIDGCFLTAPNGEVIEFLPDSNNTDARYQYTPSPPIRVCSVTINNLTVHDTGVWRLAYTNAGETEESVYNLVVGQENPTLDDNQINLLSKITHKTRTGLYIDIALSKTDYDEECFLYTPIKVDDINNNTDDRNKDIFSFATDGTYHYNSSLDSLDIEGVRKQMSSDYVSCRVTIGPMEEKLLGSWSLCGTRMMTQIKRCQPISIAWSNSLIPSSNWQSTTHPKLYYPVHFGGKVNPTIRGVGDVETCHVITPNGEDLVLTPETTYPNISLASYSDSSLCGAHIGPLHRNHLGNWTVYGRFSSWSGFNEVIQPFNFSLYDDENPYEQAYNVTTVEEPSPREVHLGDTIILDVTSSGDVKDCLFRTPEGQSYSHKNSPQTVDNVKLSAIEQTKSICRISIGPIDKYMQGEWQLTGKFESRGVFTERRHTFSIRLEDPENPWQDDTREIVDLNPQLSNVQFGGSTRASLSTSVLDGSIDSCHIRTPKGLQYIVRDGLNIDGVSVLTNSLSECSIRIQVESEDMIGDWMLITRETRFRGNSLERRLNFTIYVEEFVNILPRNVTVAMGGNLHFRLENATELYDTCKVFAPNNVEASKGYLDTASADQCAYFVPNVTTEDEGTWEIRYGTKIMYRGQITLNVLDVNTDAVYLNWTNGRPVDEVFGPEDAVYCIVRDLHNHTVYDGFGKCRIVLERASNDHNGVWSMTVGLPGKVITQKHDIYVTITDDESKAFANTTVVKSNAGDNMMVALSCSVSSEHQVRACKFREPSGRVLLATEGVGQDRYYFHGMGTSYESGIYSHDCGLRIANPTVQDFGLWRCAIETVEETYYGFLTVLCPWAMQDPTVAAQVVSEPKLTAERELVTSMEGENVDVSCYVQSAIRYCYFRSSNGSIYNVGSDLEYVGAGFDAGECGGRLPRVQVNDSGAWSCHVGLANHSLQEQRANFVITVEDALKVSQTRSAGGNDLRISAVAYQNHPLDYCRFVRIDGFGFTTENIPNDYLDQSVLSSGRCAIFIEEATLLDHHPWTVVARFSGYATEISRVTAHTIQVETGPTTGISYNFMITSVLFLVTAVLLLLCGFLMFPKKNREWTYARASSLSNTLRSSFLRKSSADKPKTAMAA